MLMDTATGLGLRWAHVRTHAAEYDHYYLDPYYNG